jgi:hypothetical protein
MFNGFFLALCALLYVSSNTDAATYYAATDGVTADCTAIQNINTPASSILAAIECANDSTGNIVAVPLQ